MSYHGWRNVMTIVIFLVASLCALQVVFFFEYTQGEVWPYLKTPNGLAAARMLSFPMRSIDHCERRAAPCPPWCDVKGGRCLNR